MAGAPSSSHPPVRVWRRVRGVLSAVAAVLVALLILQGLAPAPAHAADLFPVDDWIGDGLKKTGEFVLGPLRLGAEQIAKLLAAVVGALADLLIPKSLVRAGIDGIAWLVQLPPVGSTLTPSDGGYALTVQMPHIAELRSTLTWVGITLLPLGLVLAGGRALLAPSLYGDSPTEIVLRVIGAGVGLTVYDFAWGVLTQLSHLLTSSLLRLPWVADGIERMFEALLIGGAGGSVVAAEFVIPLLIALAGGALLALLLLRVALEIGAALLYVIGGLLLGLSPTEFGRRLLTAWLIATTAMLLLPLLWTIVFVCGAAIMLDAPAAASKGGLGEFVAQLYNVAAAIATFGIAIKLAQGVMRRAHSGIGALGATNLTGTGRGPGVPTPALGGKTHQSLAAFSRSIRGRATAVGRVGAFPARHPIRAAQALSYPVRRPVQATREAAGALRDALASASTSGATVSDTARTGAKGWFEQERHGGRFSSRSADRRREQFTAQRDTSSTATPRAPRAASPSPNGSSSRAQSPPSRRASLPSASGPTSPPPPPPGAPPSDAVPPIRPPAPPRPSANSTTRPPSDPADPSAPLPLGWARRRRRDRNRDDRKDQS